MDVFDVEALAASGARIVHVHFGFEHIAPRELEAWCGRTADAGIAIATTVHDIDNPHLIDQREHHHRVAILLDAAHHVFTLTHAANTELVRRWGRPATVVGHPSIASWRDVVAARRCVGRTRPTLVWLGSCRPSLDVDAVVNFALQSRGPFDAVVRLDGWERLGTATRDRLNDAIHLGDGTLRIVHRPDDDELVGLLRGRRALVLPYSWGTHSGFVELATDLAVTAVVPDVGCHRDQGAIVCDPSELAAAVEAAPAGPAWSVSAAARREAHANFVSIHEQVYAALLSRARTGRPTPTSSPAA